jgi:hypothetical protein
MIDAKSGPYGVLLLRISLGFLFLAHGLRPSRRPA